MSARTPVGWLGAAAVAAVSVLSPQRLRSRLGADVQQTIADVLPPLPALPFSRSLPSDGLRTAVGASPNVRCRVKVWQKRCSCLTCSRHSEQPCLEPSHM